MGSEKFADAPVNTSDDFTELSSMAFHEQLSIDWSHYQPRAQNLETLAAKFFVSSDSTSPIKINCLSFKMAVTFCPENLGSRTSLALRFFKPSALESDSNLKPSRNGARTPRPRIA